MGPTEFILALSDSFKVISFFFFYYFLYQRVTLPHFPKQTKTKLMESLFDGRKARILVEDLQTYISVQAKAIRMALFCIFCRISRVESATCKNATQPYSKTDLT